MMKVFDIQTGFNYSQTHSVVAESMAKAEETFHKEYPHTEILEIRLHSSYVQIQDAPAGDCGSVGHVVQPARLT